MLYRLSVCMLHCMCAWMFFNQCVCCIVFSMHSVLACVYMCVVALSHMCLCLLCPCHVYGTVCHKFRGNGNSINIFQKNYSELQRYTDDHDHVYSITVGLEESGETINYFVKGGLQ